MLFLIFLYESLENHLSLLKSTHKPCRLADGPSCSPTRYVILSVSLVRIFRVARSLPHPVRSLVFDSSVMGDPHTFVTCLTDRFPYLYPHQSYAGDLTLVGG